MNREAPELTGTLADQHDRRDLAEVRRLRNYYRREFANGVSDHSFLDWLQQVLEAINEQDGGRA